MVNIIKNKEKLWKEANEKLQNLSEEETEKRQKRPETDIKILWKKKKKKVLFYLAYKKYLLSWFANFFNLQTTEKNTLNEFPF